MSEEQRGGDDPGRTPDDFGPTSSERTGAVGPVLDEELKHETRGLVQGGRSSRAEEWRDPEPAGEDQVRDDDAGIVPEDRRGTPPGMTSSDVQERAEIARFLGTSAFPADRDRLLEVARANQATDRVLARLGSLPAGTTFANVQDIARYLGIATETIRT